MNKLFEHNKSSMNIYKIDEKNILYDKKTFCGYKKSDVFNELNKCLIDNRIENCCYWTAEILCSGFIDLLWEKIIIFSSIYININNPLLPQFIFQKHSEYQILKKKCKSKNFIELRNCYETRKQLFEIIITLCLSKKINIPNIPKIYNEDFDIFNIQNKLQAKNNHSIDIIFKPNDPLELKIPMNEFIFNLNNKNLNYSIFWLCWMIEYDKKITKKEKKFICHRRSIENIDEKYKDDISWLIWNSIFYCARDSVYLEQIKYLYQIYKINFNKSKKNSRISLFIHSILFIIEKIDNSIPLKNREDIIISAINNSDIIFQKLQNEKMRDLYKLNDNQDISQERKELEKEQGEKKENLTQKILKDNKKKQKKNNNLSEESQKKLDLILNITKNACY